MNDILIRMKSSARTATKVLMQWLITQALLEITPHITTYRLCTAYIALEGLLNSPKLVHSVYRLKCVVRLVIAKRNADSRSKTIFRSYWWEFSSSSIYRKASTLRFLTSPLYERTQTTLHFCQFPFGFEQMGRRGKCITQLPTSDFNSWMGYRKFRSTKRV